jgi:3-oxoacyl-[acyl-carrier protein] reductase
VSEEEHVSPRPAPPYDRFDLTGRVALITGGTRGLGRAIIQTLAQAGADVVVSSRKQEACDEAAEEARGFGRRALARACHVGHWSEIDDLVDAAYAEFGRIDILVNNVGKAGGGDIVSTLDAEWQGALDQTLFPAIRMSRLVVPHMRRGGSGVILMIASIWGRESGGRMTYNAVKAAEISLAKAMSQQLAADKIRVNSIAPGSILFDGGSWWKRQQEDPKGIAEFVRRELPFGRFGTAEEVGGVVAFLASPRASWITGACVTVDGGQSRSNF